MMQKKSIPSFGRIVNGKEVFQSSHILSPVISKTMKPSPNATPSYLSKYIMNSQSQPYNFQKPNPNNTIPDEDIYQKELKKIKYQSKFSPNHHQNRDVIFNIEDQLDSSYTNLLCYSRQNESLRYNADPSNQNSRVVFRGDNNKILNEYQDNQEMISIHGFQEKNNSNYANNKKKLSNYIINTGQVNRRKKNKSINLTKKCGLNNIDSINNIVNNVGVVGFGYRNDDLINTNNNINNSKSSVNNSLHREINNLIGNNNAMGNTKIKNPEKLYRNITKYNNNRDNNNKQRIKNPLKYKRNSKIDVYSDNKTITNNTNSTIKVNCTKTNKNVTLNSIYNNKVNKYSSTSDIVSNNNKKLINTNNNNNININNDYYYKSQMDKNNDSQFENNVERVLGQNLSSSANKIIMPLNNNSNYYNNNIIFSSTSLNTKNKTPSNINGSKPITPNNATCNNNITESNGSNLNNISNSKNEIMYTDLVTPSMKINKFLNNQNNISSKFASQCISPSNINHFEALSPSSITTNGKRNNSRSPGGKVDLNNYQCRFNFFKEVHLKEIIFLQKFIKNTIGKKIKMAIFLQKNIRGFLVRKKYDELFNFYGKICNLFDKVYDYVKIYFAKYGYQKIFMNKLICEYNNNGNVCSDIYNKLHNKYNEGFKELCQKLLAETDKLKQENLYLYSELFNKNVNNDNNNNDNNYNNCNHNFNNEVINNNNDINNYDYKLKKELNNQIYIPKIENLNSKNSNNALLSNHYRNFSNNSFKSFNTNNTNNKNGEGTLNREQYIINSKNLENQDIINNINSNLNNLNNMNNINSINSINNINEDEGYNNSNNNINNINNNFNSNSGFDFIENENIFNNANINNNNNSNNNSICNNNNILRIKSSNDNLNPSASGSSFFSKNNNNNNNINNINNFSLKDDGRLINNNLNNYDIIYNNDKINNNYGNNNNEDNNEDNRVQNNDIQIRFNKNITINDFENYDNNKSIRKSHTTDSIFYNKKIVNPNRNMNSMNVKKKAQINQKNNITNLNKCNCESTESIPISNSNANSNTNINMNFNKNINSNNKKNSTINNINSINSKRQYKISKNSSTIKAKKYIHSNPNLISTNQNYLNTITNSNLQNNLNQKDKYNTNTISAISNDNPFILETNYDKNDFIINNPNSSCCQTDTNKVKKLSNIVPFKNDLFENDYKISAAGSFDIINCDKINADNCNCSNNKTFNQKELFIDNIIKEYTLKFRKKKKVLKIQKVLSDLFIDHQNNKFIKGKALVVNRMEDINIIGDNENKDKDKDNKWNRLLEINESNLFINNYKNIDENEDNIIDVDIDNNLISDNQGDKRIKLKSVPKKKIVNKDDENIIQNKVNDIQINNDDYHHRLNIDSLTINKEQELFINNTIDNKNNINSTKESRFSNLLQTKETEFCVENDVFEESSDIYEDGPNDESKENFNKCNTFMETNIKNNIFANKNSHRSINSACNELNVTDNYNSEKKEQNENNYYDRNIREIIKSNFIKGISEIKENELFIQSKDIIKKNKVEFDVSSPILVFFQRDYERDEKKKDKDVNDIYNSENGKNNEVDLDIETENEIIIDKIKEINVDLLKEKIDEFTISSKNLNERISEINRALTVNNESSINILNNCYNDEEEINTDKNKNKFIDITKENEFTIINNIKEEIVENSNYEQNQTKESKLENELQSEDLSLILNDHYAPQFRNINEITPIKDVNIEINKQEKLIDPPKEEFIESFTIDKKEKLYSISSELNKIDIISNNNKIIDLKIDNKQTINLTGTEKNRELKISSNLNELTIDSTIIQKNTTPSELSTNKININFNSVKGTSTFLSNSTICRNVINISAINNQIKTNFPIYANNNNQKKIMPNTVSINTNPIESQNQEQTQNKKDTINTKSENEIINNNIYNTINSQSDDNENNNSSFSSSNYNAIKSNQPKRILVSRAYNKLLLNDNYSSNKNINNDNNNYNNYNNDDIDKCPYKDIMDEHGITSGRSIKNYNKIINKDYFSNNNNYNNYNNYNVLSNRDLESISSIDNFLYNKDYKISNFNVEINNKNDDNLTKNKDNFDLNSVNNLNNRKIKLIKNIFPNKLKELIVNNCRLFVLEEIKNFLNNKNEFLKAKKESFSITDIINKSNENDINNNELCNDRNSFSKDIIYKIFNSSSVYDAANEIDKQKSNKINRLFKTIKSFYKKNVISFFYKWKYFYDLSKFYSNNNNKNNKNNKNTNNEYLNEENNINSNISNNIDNKDNEDHHHIIISDIIEPNDKSSNDYNSNSSSINALISDTHYMCLNRMIDTLLKKFLKNKELFETNKIYPYFSKWKKQSFAPSKKIRVSKKKIKKPKKSNKNIRNNNPSTNANTNSTINEQSIKLLKNIILNIIPQQTKNKYFTLWKKTSNTSNETSSINSTPKTTDEIKVKLKNRPNCVLLSLNKNEKNTNTTTNISSKIINRNNDPSINDDFSSINKYLKNSNKMTHSMDDTSSLTNRKKIKKVKRNVPFSNRERGNSKGSSSSKNTQGSKRYKKIKVCKKVIVKSDKNISINYKSKILNDIYEKLHLKWFIKNWMEKTRINMMRMVKLCSLLLRKKYDFNDEDNKDEGNYIKKICFDKLVIINKCSKMKDLINKNNNINI